jgi:DNA-binding transcriptional ArsR family regulator
MGWCYYCTSPSRASRAYLAFQSQLCYIFVIYQFSGIKNQTSTKPGSGLSEKGHNFVNTVDNSNNTAELPPILPEEVPVSMPDLPRTLVLSTVQQMKALGDALRVRILGLIQYQPATAKQIADRLGIAPSSIGHHLHVLEAAGLVQIVARRAVRGTVANYYARTALLFEMDPPPEIIGMFFRNLVRINQARNELAESNAHSPNNAVYHEEFFHLRLSSTRAQEYARRLQELTDSFLRAEPDPDGQIYDLYTALFLAPPALQVEPQLSEPYANASGDQQAQEGQ